MKMNRLNISSATGSETRVSWRQDLRTEWGPEVESALRTLARFVKAPETVAIWDMAVALVAILRFDDKQLTAGGLLDLINGDAEKISNLADWAIECLQEMHLQRELN